MQVQGPFFNIAKAAEYCGYRPKSFSVILKEYDIPRHGPRNNRLAKSTLDAFMESPERFKRNEAPRRRKPQEVKV